MEAGCVVEVGMGGCGCVVEMGMGGGGCVFEVGWVEVGVCG